MACWPNEVLVTKIGLAYLYVIICTVAPVTSKGCGGSRILCVCLYMCTCMYVLTCTSIHGVNCLSLGHRVRNHD